MVKLRVLHGIWVDNVPRSVGDVVEVDEAEAPDLVASGRLELLDPKQQPLLKVWQLKAIDAALKKAGPVHVANPGSPWLESWRTR